MKLTEYMNSLPPERQAKILKRSNELLEDMNLGTVRQVAQFTQQKIASRLKISQAAVSKIESRTDMLLSTLRKYIEAAGGTLAIVVNLPGMKFEFGSLAEVFNDQKATLQKHQVWSCITNGVVNGYLIGNDSMGKRVIPLGSARSAQFAMTSDSSNEIEQAEYGPQSSTA